MKATLAIAIVLAVCGCSRNYYAGEFQADDSTGDARSFLVEWQATDMWLDFLPWKDDATPVALHTQGGERTILFTERTGADDLGKCAATRGAGILFCGTRGEDSLAGAPLTERELCGVVNTAGGAERIVDLADAIQIEIYCTPQEPEKRIGAIRIDKDYLAASTEPYEIRVQKLSEDEFLALKAKYGSAE